MKEIAEQGCRRRVSWEVSLHLLINEASMKCPALYYVVCNKSALDLILMKVLKEIPITNMNICNIYDKH